MGRSHEHRKSHDQYAREALAPVRRSLLTLFHAIKFHSGQAGLTEFISTYGAAYGLTPDVVYRGQVTRIDEGYLMELSRIARENGYIYNAFGDVEEM